MVKTHVVLKMLQHLVSAGIKGIWNLQKSSSDSFDTYLVLAFVGETRILEINAEDELDEAEIEGFDAEQQVHTSLLPAHDFTSTNTSLLLASHSCWLTPACCLHSIQQYGTTRHAGLPICTASA